MQADYLVNSGTKKIKITSGEGTTEATGVTEGTAVTIKVTEENGSVNAYKFSGIVGITFTAGTVSAQPSVAVAACSKTGDAAVTFGGSVAGTTTTPAG